MDGASLFDTKLGAAFAAHFAIEQRRAGRNDDAGGQSHWGETALRIYERLRGSGRFEPGIERKMPDAIDTVPGEKPELVLETSEQTAAPARSSTREPAQH
jgi:hypothetical protein